MPRRRLDPRNDYVAVRLGECNEQTRWVLEQYEFNLTSIHNADIRAGRLRQKFDAIIIADQDPRGIIDGFDSNAIRPEYRGGIGEAPRVQPPTAYADAKSARNRPSGTTRGDRFPDLALTDTKGTVLDSSEGPDSGEPLSYMHGSGMIVPGLEEALAGKSAGDHVKVTIGPEDGYGARQESLLQKVSRDEFPEGDIEVGMHFRAHGPHGPRVLTVVATDKDSITVDGNHPLAGATLNFDVKVVGVREATPQDIHGSAHGDHDCTSCHGCGGH